MDEIFAKNFHQNMMWHCFCSRSVSSIAGSQSADEVTSSVHRASSSIDSPEATNLPIIKSSKLRFDKLKRRHKHKALEDRPLVKKAKLVVGGKFQVKMKSRIGRFDARERPMRIKTSETMEEKRSKRKQCVSDIFLIRSLG